MYHNALIRKDHPRQAELEKVIELFLAFSDANSIYFSSHIEEDLNEGIIIVIIDNDSSYDWDELNGYYQKVFQSFPQFSFRIFDSNWMKEELKEGNLFFAIHCNHNTLLYSTKESNEFLLVKKLRPRRFLNKARNRFKMDEHAAFTIGINVKFYVRGSNNLQAAYMLHQNIRWLYVAASWFLTGEWLVENDLEVQQRHLGKFSKALGNVFDGNNLIEKELMGLLNASYRSVQKGDEMPEISIELIEAAEAKKECVRREAGRLFEECASRCRYEFSRTRNPLIEIDQSNPLQWITKTITDAIEPSAIYCFGKRNLCKSTIYSILDNSVVDFQTAHYYLFLIVKDYQGDVAGNISYIIKTESKGKYSVTIIMHSKKSLCQKKGDQQHFFYQIMQRGELLFQESARPPYLPFEEIPSRDIRAAKKYLQQRQCTASFLQKTEGLSVEGVTKMRVYLMCLVVEQTSLGLIRLFLGYTPHHFSLHYLFELCEYFTSLTSELFPRESQKDKQLLKILSTASLRYGSVDNVDTRDYEILNNRYNEFVDRANSLVKEELKRLEQSKEEINQNN